MTDVFTKEKRSKVMSNIKSKNTSIEELVRKFLFSRGIRYRKNDKRYCGKPDIVIPKYKTIVFVHGCFWHRHKGCKFAYMPKTRENFWKEKFNMNVQRDELCCKSLTQCGWNVITVWECELRKNPEIRLIQLYGEITGK